jgi:hypothetical protein
MIHRVRESSIRVPTGIEGHRTVCKKWQGGRRNHHSHRLAQHPFLVTPVSKCLFIQLYGGIHQPAYYCTNITGYLVDVWVAENTSSPDPASARSRDSAKHIGPDPEPVDART